MNFFLKKHQTLFLILFCLVSFSVAQADFSSTNFTLENPINIIEGGQSSSTSFQYLSSTGQTVGGQSTSTSFAQNAGLLYFPTATSPVIQATAGNAQVSLSWTAAVPTFANITSYEVGTSTVSGGPFTYESVGAVLTFNKTALSNGTQYFFKVRSFAAGILLSESVEATATPTAPVVGGGGGGGGGGITPISATSVVFSGKAYPKSIVTILKDAQIVTTVAAGTDANFQTSVSSLSAGNYIFSVYSEDKDGRRSGLLTFPVSLTEGATTNITGIFLAPTIATDKTEVKKGDNIAIFGQSAPSADIVITVNSEEEFFAKTISDKDGIYLNYFDTTFLEMGSHSTKSKASIGNQLVSTFSPLVNFKVGTKNVFASAVEKCPAKGDLNNDCRVNLIDFSIAAFWYKKTLNTATITLEKAKLNGDGKINLVDFSIMAYYWTG